MKQDVQISLFFQTENIFPLTAKLQASVLVNQRRMCGP